MNNLTLIIDRNNIQIDGFTEEIMPLESLKAKYEAFNWRVLEVDGNNILAFVESVRTALAVFEKANGNYRQHNSGQRRFIYGKRFLVARQTAKPGRSQKSASRT